MNNCYISLLPALWLGSRVFPFQIDNSVPVSCDVAAGACFFCNGFIGRLRTDRQNISDKTLPYLMLNCFRSYLTLNIVDCFRHVIFIKGRMDSEMERLDSILEQIRKKAVVEAVDAMVCEQIKIAGSKILYKRIDKSFKEGSMEPYFLTEQWMLYSWREILPALLPTLLLVYRGC